MPTPSSDIAFTPAVKALQVTRGSRDAYARLEARGGFQTELTPDLGAFLESAVTAYLATVSAAGQPYVQHRGGPPGFIRVLGEKILGFADYHGNRQYISTGNISENNRATLIVVDYAERRRVKLWGRARFDSDPELIARLMPENYHARPEQALLFDVEAWDINCSQHIPQLLPAESVARALQELHARIDALESENAKLRTLVEALDPGERS
jgi:predicted pyridoxine 5'-phosphate oxidase superfamily flavin-nucleotide-binding protein